MKVKKVKKKMKNGEKNVQRIGSWGGRGTPNWWRSCPKTYRKKSVLAIEDYTRKLVNSAHKLN